MVNLDSGEISIMIFWMALRALSFSSTSTTISIQPMPVPERMTLPIRLSEIIRPTLSLVSSSCFVAKSSPGHRKRIRKFLSGELSDAMSAGRESCAGSLFEQLMTSIQITTIRRTDKLNLMPNAMLPHHIFIPRQIP
jgi:hypothetical protein